MPTPRPFFLADALVQDSCMQQDVLELYPGSGHTHALQGLYLGQVPEHPRNAPGPFIYSNFIVSTTGNNEQAKIYNK